MSAFATMKTEAVSLNTKQYYRDLRANLRALARAQAREFIVEVIQRVPVWSGQSAGSLVPFARSLGESVSIRPVAKRGKKPYNMVSAGMGEQRYHLPGSASTYNFRFEFETTVGTTISGERVPYFALNDTRNMDRAMKGRLRNPTPWHSFKHGRNAAKKFWIQYGQDYIPNLRRYRNKISTGVNV